MPTSLLQASLKVPHPRTKQQPKTKTKLLTLFVKQVAMYAKIGEAFHFKILNQHGYTI